MPVCIVYYFELYIQIFWKKVSYSLSLHLVEMNTDPDPDRNALDADPDTPNDADQTRSGSTALNTICISYPLSITKR